MLLSVLVLVMDIGILVILAKNVRLADSIDISIGPNIGNISKTY